MQINNFKWLILLFFLSILFSNCFISGKSNVKYEKILFGKGGGFTGKYDDYYLSSNGNLFKKEPSSKEFLKIKTLNKKETKNIFKEIDDNKLFESEFNHPFNISCYIEIVKGTSSNRIVWGNTQNQPPATVEIIFNKLMSFVKDSK